MGKVRVEGNCKRGTVGGEEACECTGNGHMAKTIASGFGMVNAWLRN